MLLLILIPRGSGAGEPPDKKNDAPQDRAAAPDLENQKRANALMKEAEEARKAGDREEALILLRRAQARVPNAPGPHRMIGQIEFERGNCAKAALHYRDYLKKRNTIIECGAAREPLDDDARIAIVRIEKCEKRGSVRIESEPSGATVRFDDEKIPSTTTPQPRCNLSVGPHRAIVEESGYLPATISFEIRAAETTQPPRVTLASAPLPTPPPSPPAEPSPKLTHTPAAPAVSVPAPPRWYERGWVWGVIAGGALIVGTSVATGVYLGTRDPLADVDYRGTTTALHSW